MWETLGGIRNKNVELPKKNYTETEKNLPLSLAVSTYSSIYLNRSQTLGDILDKS